MFAVRGSPRKRSASACSYTTCDDENDDPGEQRVADITIEFFYKPRTITLLIGVIVFMLYFAFIRDADKSNPMENCWHGFLGVVGAFFVICLLVCPNGPFIRPHPAVWRLVLGLSIIYVLLLIFALFQSYSSIRDMLSYLDPNLRVAKPDTEVYAEDCSLGVFWSRLDVFCVAHVLGWFMKAIMLRHAGLCWLISITWEFTEIAFSHLLANFKECWWDSIFLDVIICNGAGIYLGLWASRQMEMKQYHWESIKDIKGTTKKFRRAMLQFTPISWTEVRWLHPKSGVMRFLALVNLLIIWQISELNTFFLKHIFIVPTHHILNWLRLGMVMLIVTPSLKQYYVYVTDTRSKRIGTQCWMFVCMTFLEMILCIRHARELFSQTDLTSIAVWVIGQMLVCFILLYSCLELLRRRKSVSEEDMPLSPSSHARHITMNDDPDSFEREVQRNNSDGTSDSDTQDYEAADEEDEVSEKPRLRKSVRRTAKST